MTQTSHFITGLDIGGAHLKYARIDSTGKIIEVKQYVCPLWKGLIFLEQALDKIINHVDNTHDTLAITMTGELVDIFVNRRSGVAEILDCVTTRFNQAQCYVFAGNLGWLKPNDAKKNWQDVASRNWQASALFCAKQHDNAIFIDLGSTTCDIIPIKHGQAVPTGYTDQQRQTSRELLYTGSIRTPLIALTNTAPFDGNLISIAAEVFATTGDVWRLLGVLEQQQIQDSSADGQSWSLEHCARRLARLLGTDAENAPTEAWLNLAKWFAQQQINQINNALLQVISAHPVLHNVPIITAGVGAAIIHKCAQQLDHPSIPFNHLVTPSITSASEHAPAVAVALLAYLELT